MKKKWIFVLGYFFILGIITPVFGQETDFVYLDHLLVYRTGQNFHINRWHDIQYTGPMTDKNNKIYNYGIGMFSDNYDRSGIGYAEYQINRAYSLFEATLALEKGPQNNSWITGDMGTTRFIIYADGVEIYNVRLISSSEPIKISVVIPKNTNLLRLEVEQIAGTGGTHGAIWGFAILKK